MAPHKATKNFLGNAKRALAVEGLTVASLAVELGCATNSVSRAINRGGKVCPGVHRRVANRLKLKPLI